MIIGGTQIITNKRKKTTPAYIRKFTFSGSFQL